MPVSFEFLRGVLGIIGLGCAYLTGRALAAVRRGWMKPPKFYGWILRSLICLGALVVRNPIDRTTITIWTLAAAAFAIAYWQTLNRKPPEDLSSQIVPHE